jgi:undecaprenyl diphosphate synthase
LLTTGLDFKYQDIDSTLGPKHVAIIMDGNRRWAREHNLSVAEGHFQGAENLVSLCEKAPSLGIEIITAYSFSTENWNRPSKEVDCLMDLFVDFLTNKESFMIDKGVRLRHIGDVSQLPKKVQNKLQAVTHSTANNSKIQLVLAINYGGRNELLRAFKTMALDLEKGALTVNELSENHIAHYLDTSYLKDPDLLIRTSGEYRVSNFLLWQLSYAEMYFTKRYWPDFNSEELYKAVLEFQQRHRRLGGGQ